MTSLWNLVLLLFHWQARSISIGLVGEEEEKERDKEREDGRFGFAEKNEDIAFGCKFDSVFSVAKALILNFF
ncbi:hypothetical protein ACLOJK_005372 [Asimina triloba]